MCRARRGAGPASRPAARRRRGRSRSCPHDATAGPSAAEPVELPTQIAPREQEADDALGVDDAPFVDVVALDGNRPFLGVDGRWCVQLLDVEGGVEVGVLVAEAGRVEELAQLHEPARATADLLVHLARRGRLGRLALDIALARHDLE